MMFHNTVKTFCLFTLGCFSTLSVLAVPAQPGPMKFINGNNELTVYLHGDENFHYYTTSDGYLLDYRDDISLTLTLERTM